MKISSRQNERIKFVKKLHRRRYRDQSRLYIAEGLRLVEDLSSTDMIQEVYYTDRLVSSPRGQELLEQLQESGVNVYLCSEEAFGDIADTDNTQGILAIVHQPELVVNWEHKLKQGLVLVVDQIQDPGNLGTIMRTALAAGVDGIWMIKGTVDPFNPKVVRSSMGAVQKLPLASMTARECAELSSRFGLKLIAADLENADPYYDTDLAQPCAIVIGNEGSGIQLELLKHCTERIFIPLANDVESLNASVAAAVLIYESVRQRQFLV